MNRWIKRTLNDWARRAGYEIRTRRQITKDGAHEAIHTAATYSPWNLDAEFRRVFDIIAHQTLVDRYRCYDLWSLLGEVGHLEGAVLEVGVWRGGTGALLARRAQLCSPKAHVFLCDTFRGVVKASERDSNYRGGEHADAALADVKTLLERVGADGVTILAGVFPDETAARIPPQPFRFCHIDVDVYESAKQTAEWIWDRLVVGGIIVFDDYGFYGCDGVRAYVDEQRHLTDRVTLYNLNGHATIVKLR